MGSQNLEQMEVQKETSVKTKLFGTETLIRKWGCSISEAVRDFRCELFSIPGVEGFIGYRLFQDCAVVVGDPICSEEKMPELTMAFENHCKEKGWERIYFIVSESFAKWAVPHICKVQVGVGDEIIFNPQQDPTNGHKNQKLRNNIHHAQNLGLSVEEYVSYNPNIENALHELRNLWLASRKGPQIYLANLNFFENRKDRRWFYLKNENQNIIGMTLLIRLDAYDGWLLKFHIILPNIHRGASELLMTSIMETLRRENCSYLTYGIMPADHLKEIVGISSVKTWFLNKFFKFTTWFFKLNQRKVFWQKFHPKSKSSYLLFSNQIGIKEMRALSNTLKTDIRLK